MPAKIITDWSKIDWQRLNSEIAVDLNCSEWTVINNRKKYAPETKNKFRSSYKFTPASKARQLIQASKNGIKNQPKATAAAKKSAKSGKFETNIKSKQWRVVSPEGKVYQITNLYNWVRENENLFTPKDAEWKRQGGKRGTGGEYCNATAGLSNVKSGKSKAWKGWTLEIDPN